jgi:hypothetical protein
VARLQAGQSGFESWRRQESFLQNVLIALGLTQFPIQQALGFFLPGHKVDHVSPSSSKVKNGWSNMSTLHTCLDGVDRYNFTSCMCRFITLSPGDALRVVVA